MDAIEMSIVRVMKRNFVMISIASFVLVHAAVPAATQELDSEPLQRGFGSLVLGMTLPEAQEALQVDPSFRYRGGPDVQFVPLSDRPLIETAGRAFVDRGTFQFRDDRLYLITLSLNDDRLDYFTVYRSLVDQYGEPVSLDPGQALWEDEATRIALERPLTVKYIDRPTFDSIIESGRMQEALDEVTRERFLEQL